MTPRADLICLVVARAIGTGDPLHKSIQALISEWVADETHKPAVRYFQSLQPASKAENRFQADLRARLVAELGVDQCRVVIARQSQPVVNIAEQLPLHWWTRLATALLTRDSNGLQAAAEVLRDYLEAHSQCEAVNDVEALMELARDSDRLQKSLAEALGDVAYQDKNGREIAAGQWVLFADRGKTRLGKVAGLARSEPAFIVEWLTESGRCERRSIPAPDVVYAEPTMLNYVHTAFLNDSSSQARSFRQYLDAGGAECRAVGCRFLRMKRGAVHAWFDTCGQHHYGFTVFEVLDKEPESRLEGLLKQAVQWATEQTQDVPAWCAEARSVLSA